MTTAAESSSSSSTAAAAVLPVGFRFRPTDEELVRHYLKAKIAGRAHPDLLAIPDVDLAAVEPWDLPARSVIKSDDPEWFFFARRDRPKYPGNKAPRSCRSTAAGYWKATGKDRLIRAPGPGGRGKGALIGVKKTLVFHRGRAPRGARTPWIMHEYTATEPHLQSQSGPQNDSFVLYRLFNKQDEEAPAPILQSPSMSSAGNPLLQADDTSSASMVEDKASPSDSSQLTPTNVTTDHSSAAHLLTAAGDAEQTADQEAAFLNTLTQLPDLQLQAEHQRYDEFPSISSPMRPYTDLPFVGNMGDEQDFSPYLDGFIAEQDLQDMLPNPAYDKTGAGNAVSNPTAAVTFCSTSSGSWTPYPQDMLDSMAEPSRSDMINSNGQGGWAAASWTQQPAAPEFIDPQQGTAARRIRLVCAVERAPASQPILTSHSESEDEAESCCSTGSSSSNHDKDHVNRVAQTMAGDQVNTVSQTMAGDVMHIQGRVRNIPPTQVVDSWVEVADKLQHLSFNDNILEQHVKLPYGTGLKQRLKQDSAQSAHGVLLQNSDRVLEKASKKQRDDQPCSPSGWLSC